MGYYLSKLAITATLIVVISEVAKRHSGLAALLASLPLTSLLAILWLKVEGAPAQQITELCQQIFWLVIPSLVFFIILPIMLKQGIGFYISLGLASAITSLCYLLLIPLLRYFGVLSTQ